MSRALEETLMLSRHTMSRPARLRLGLTGALALALAACGDPLDVTNVNNPETERVLASASDVEKSIADAYLTWWNASYGTEGLMLQMSAMAFEHSPMAANFGMIERSALPRTLIVNTSSDQFATFNNTMWNSTYAAIRQATDGLQRIDAGAVKFAADTTNRARAFARFVQGIGHAHLAITFDSAQVLTDFDTTSNYVGHKEVMVKAQALLDSAIAIAGQTQFAGIPNTWINGNALSASQFIRLVYSYKARFRAQDARTPAEAAQVNWETVLADLDRGLTGTFSITMDDNVWTNVNTYYHSFYGAWNQTNMQVLGMADTSGAYQAWIRTAPGTRQPFVIRTPDRRWPSDTTAGAAGTIYTFRGNAGSWVRADRGTWRWSNYRDERYDDFYGTFRGAYPVILEAELDLLRAEALIRLGRAAEALPIINEYRAQGSLPPATLAGTSGDACVPRLPSGACGDLFEALKYEKRIAIANTVYGGWYFDSRRWGDLPQGTMLDWPVPAREQEVRLKPPYNTGGSSGRSSAPVGTYGY
jgi:hypothetical protein